MPLPALYGLDDPPSTEQVNADCVHPAARPVSDTKYVPIPTFFAPVVPFPRPVTACDATFDAARAERVIEHVPDPAAAIAEMLRVVKPGGQVLVTDPDHGLWAPDLDDRRLTRTIMNWWSDHVPNPWVARRLRDLFVRAGAADVRVRLQPVVLTSLAAADALTWIGKAAQAAGAKGVVDAGEARAWGEEILRRDAEGRFLMFGTFVVATGTKQ